jgi:Uroporphyrinogen decarboxylase (URO-D)
MTSRERMAAAMRPAQLHTLDRVPVMCQLALGHYFLNTSIPAVDIWHDSNAFAEALVTLQRRYGFDGILVNLPGRDPAWREAVSAIEERDGPAVVRWKEGAVTIVPPDDNPRVTGADGRKRRPPNLSAIDPDRLFYVEPYDRLGVTTLEAFPPWQFDTVKRVRLLAPDVSLHAEIFSPFTQLIELLGIEEAMMALLDDPSKATACLARLVEGTAALGAGLLDAGADAILMSSAYAGAGFISRAHYEEFVLPFEREVIARIKQSRETREPIVYTHTCGAIGDRLELMEESGTDGIDTLDPPPLGTVDLADARRRLCERTFIKGNIDPVNTLLRGSPDDCHRDAAERIAIAGPRGYVLSTACSVPPHARPENIEAIVRAARETACVA